MCSKPDGTWSARCAMQMAVVLGWASSQAET